MLLEAISSENLQTAAGSPKGSRIPGKGEAETPLADFAALFVESSPSDPAISPLGIGDTKLPDSTVKSKTPSILPIYPRSEKSAHDSPNTTIGASAGLSPDLSKPAQTLDIETGRIPFKKAAKQYPLPQAGTGQIAALNQTDTTAGADEVSLPVEQSRKDVKSPPLVQPDPTFTKSISGTARELDKISAGQNSAQQLALTDLHPRVTAPGLLPLRDNPISGLLSANKDVKSPPLVQPDPAFTKSISGTARELDKISAGQNSAQQLALTDLHPRVTAPGLPPLRDNPISGLLSANAETSLRSLRINPEQSPGRLELIITPDRLVPQNKSAFDFSVSELSALQQSKMFISPNPEYMHADPAFLTAETILNVTGLSGEVQTPSRSFLDVAAATTRSALTAPSTAISAIVVNPGEAVSFGRTERGVTVKLSPPEMGSVFIDFEFTAEKSVVLTVRAETGEVRELLRQRADILGAALQEAGLEHFEMNFDTFDRDRQQRARYFLLADGELSAAPSADNTAQDKSRILQQSAASYSASSTSINIIL